MISRTAILATILVVMAVLSICSASSNKVGVVVPLGASTQPRSASSKHGSVKSAEEPSKDLAEIPEESNKSAPAAAQGAMEE
jgi:hypothetical protein